MDPRSIRIKLRIPTEPPTYQFIRIKISSISELRRQAALLLSSEFPNLSSRDWQLQVNRPSSSDSVVYSILGAEDVIRLTSEDIIFPSVGPLSAQILPLHSAPLKVRMGIPFSLELPTYRAVVGSLRGDQSNGSYRETIFVPQ